MDYFYVADGFGPNGLINYYLKSKYKPKDNLTLSLGCPWFCASHCSNERGGTELDKGLGTEIDFVFNYALTKVINIEGGYSAMFSSDTMTSSKVKNVKNPDTSSNWAYLMISIKPEFVFKP